MKWAQNRPNLGVFGYFLDFESFDFIRVNIDFRAASDSRTASESVCEGVCESPNLETFEVDVVGIVGNEVTVGSNC